MTETYVASPPVAAPVVAPRRMSWGAVIAGAILTFTVQVMLGLLGLGIGLASIDPATNDTPTLSTFGTTSGIWAIVTVLIATFVGGYAAARLAASLTKTDGALHGLVTWATSTLLVIYLLTSGAGSLIYSTLGTVGTSLSSITSAVRTLAPDSLGALPDGLEAQARQLLQRAQTQTGQAVDQVQDQAAQTANQVRAATGEPNLADAIPEIVRGLRQGASPQDRQAAVSVIATQAGISQAEAEQRLQQFQVRYDQAVAQATQAADAAAENASTAAFAGFVALLVGAIVALLGGIAGRTRPVVRPVVA